MMVELPGQDRWQVIDELLDSLVAGGKIAAQNREPIKAAVCKRELAMSTGIGFGIGIPHASTDLISEIVQKRAVVSLRSTAGYRLAALRDEPEIRSWGEKT